MNFHKLDTPGFLHSDQEITHCPHSRKPSCVQLGPFPKRVHVFLNYVMWHWVLFMCIHKDTHTDTSVYMHIEIWEFTVHLG